MVAPLFRNRVETGEFSPSGAGRAPDDVAADLGATVMITDYDVDDAPKPDDLQRMQAPLSEVLSEELEGASRHLRVPAEQILLAALARTVHRTIGSGVVAVDLVRQSTVETTVHAVGLSCASPSAVDATEMLTEVRAAIAGATARHGAHPEAEVAFSYADPAPACEVIPGLGHALKLRAYRSGDVLNLDWWYDTRRFEEYTIVELTEQFPLALIEIASEAVPTAVDAA
jgi:hypothetical protein